MRRRIIGALMAIGMTGPALAQSTPNSNPVVDRYTANNGVPATTLMHPGSLVPGYDGATPTMKRQRLARTLALRELVGQRLAAGGGVLSDTDRRDIARMYHRIAMTRRGG